MITEIREWTMWLAEWIIVAILIAEYKYDEQKDLAKKQKKTKTTKKTVTEPSGTSTTEETTEVVEPSEDKK